MFIVVAAMAVSGPVTAAFGQADGGAEGGAEGGEVRVEGNQRIESETVRQYMKLDPGRPATDEDLDNALKSLFDSGLFADVVIDRDGADMVVRVVENPIINRIVFEGNRRITDEDLEAELELRPRVVFTRARVQRDVLRIIDIYRRSGRFTANVEPKVIELPQNRLDLVFEIGEGDLTEISDIAFIGNKAFDDGDLREVIQTKETAWYRFLTSGDTYDPDRLTFDRELLRRHYLSEGYADFRVITAIAELTPEKDAFFITFALSEGGRYQFGEIGVDTEIDGVDIDALRERLTVRTGEWYNSEEVESSIGRLTDTLGDLGYAHVEVEPRVRRDGGSLTIDVAFVINESPRVIVERIDIVGNVRTEDGVIRREFLLVEGDIFNTSKLRRSRQRIVNLGFFDKVEVTNDIGSADDRTVVKVAVQERSTGALSVGVGYTTEGGAVTDLGIRERNLLGRGQDLELRLEVGAEKDQATLRFTEPYFLDRELSAGFDVYHAVRDLQDESSYNSESSGIALRAGYAISEHLFQRWTYRLERLDITDVGTNASSAVREQSGRTTVSSIGQTLLYDRRDNRLDPTEGYSVRQKFVAAGVGGDRRHLRTEMRADYYIPLAEEWILAAEAEGGYLFDLGDSTRITERYYLGGSSLRGFEVRGVGPRDSGENGDSLGGDWFYRGSLRMTFPLGLPNELGLRASTFVDFGSVGGIEAGEGILDDSSMRAAAGVGLGWRTPLGPLTLSWTWPIAKENFDKTERFRLGIGTRF